MILKETVCKHRRGEMSAADLQDELPHVQDIIHGFQLVVDELEHELTKLARTNDTGAQRILNQIRSKQ